MREKILLRQRVTPQRVRLPNKQTIFLDKVRESEQMKFTIKCYDNMNKTNSTKR